jgi:hypothetical protein
MVCKPGKAEETTRESEEIHKHCKDRVFICAQVESRGYPKIVAIKYPTHRRSGS